MPMHDWMRVADGIYHAFHYRYVAAISDALNSGVLPPDHYALPEQETAGYGPDILALRLRTGSRPPGSNGPTATITAVAPATRFTAAAAPDRRPRKKNRIAVKHVSGDETVAVVEVVSPGNKDSRHAMRSFIDKAADLIEKRVHLLVIDPFPPGPRDPQGIHAAIWGEVADQDFTPPPDKPLTLASYEADVPARAYIEPVAVGDRLRDMPLFLEPGRHVLVPLEASYAAAWAVFPARWREVLDAP